MSQNVKKSAVHQLPREGTVSSHLANHVFLISANRDPEDDARRWGRVLQSYPRPRDVPMHVIGVLVEFSDKAGQWMPVGIARAADNVELLAEITLDSILSLAPMGPRHDWWNDAIVTGIMGPEPARTGPSRSGPNDPEPWRSILLLESLDPPKCEEAVLALGQSGDVAALPVLVRLTQESDSKLAEAAHHAIGKFAWVRGRLDLTDLSSFANTAHRDEALAAAAARALASSDDHSKGKDAEMLKGEIEGLTLDEVADEVGGIPEEILGWIENQQIALVDATAARAGHISGEDFRRIERHQVAVDIQRCFKDPEKFLDTRFERFGDKTPRELLTSDDADLVRDLVWQVKSGAMS